MGYKDSIASNGYIDSIILAGKLDNPGIKVSCRKGCNHCCVYPVSITDDEEKLILKVIEQGIEIDKERLKKQASWESSRKAWLKQKREDRKCVFNSAQDGSCRIYDYRPMKCRDMLVVSSPEQCLKASNGNAEIKKVISPNINAFILEQVNKSKSMDNLSIRLNNRFN